MPKRKMSVACEGCGSTQSLRPSKVVKSQYFTCSKANPNWSHPYKPDGFIRVVKMNAAAGFYGHDIRPASLDEQAAVERAKKIEIEGQKQILK